MELIPIQESLEDNQDLMNDPVLKEILPMTIIFFQNVGYVPPWIGYCVREGQDIVGSAAFKGPPVGGTVEIAYGTLEPFRQKGIGREICRHLVELSLKTDPLVRITARTLPTKNFSTRILEANGFVLLGMVIDRDDGEVWEWEYKKS